MDAELLKEIEEVFPFVVMPPANEIAFHPNGCFECDDLCADLEQVRDEEVTGDTIRLVHQEMSHLSAQAWRWILPHYLRFCLTPEAEYNRMETEFLIYALGPDLRFQTETMQRLSYLNKKQTTCLIHFLERCSRHPYWKEYCPDDIDRAINFLKLRK